jgi:hypothetical protein
MSIVDAEDPPTPKLVQGKGIGNTMRSLSISQHTPGIDLDPVPAADLGEKAIEIEQAVEAFVAPRHPIMISDGDN